MEKTRQELIATQTKHQIELDRQRHDMAMAVQNHQTNLMFEADRHAQALASERAMNEVKLSAMREQSAAKAKAIKTPKVKA
jgi:hypothetical protein